MNKEQEIEIYGPDSPDLQEGDKVLFRGHWRALIKYDGTDLPYRLQGESWCSREDLYGRQVRRAKPEPEPEPVVQIEVGSKWKGKYFFEGYIAKVTAVISEKVRITVPEMGQLLCVPIEQFLAEFDKIEEPKPETTLYEEYMPTHIEIEGKVYPFKDVKLLREVK